MNFDEFEKTYIIQHATTENPAWKTFERKVIKWWFENNPTWDVKDYWQWSKWPNRSEHQFKLSDMGIDGVAELQSGELWAIQIKFRSNPNTSLDWEKTFSFFAFAARPDKRVFDRRVLITNTCSMLYKCI